MINTGIFGHAHLENLKKAVDVYARRHQVTAQNISNVETQGYRAKRLKFEELLDGANMRLEGTRTNRHHVPIGGRGGAVQDLVEETDSDFDNGTNNVDIDSEMTTLATNDLSYRMATRLLSGRYAMLRGAIKGQIG